MERLEEQSIRLPYYVYPSYRYKGCVCAGRRRRAEELCEKRLGSGRKSS